MVGHALVAVVVEYARSKVDVYNSKCKTAATALHMRPFSVV